MGIAGIRNDDQLLVALAVQHKVSQRIEGHGVWILQVQRDGCVQRNVNSAGIALQYAVEIHRAVPQLDADNRWRRIRVDQRVRRAEVDLAASEGDVVVTPAVWPSADDIKRCFLRLRINYHQPGIAVFVLQCPYFVSDWVHLYTVDMPEHGIGVHHTSVHVVFHYLAAQPVDAARIVSIAIAYKYVIIQNRDVVWRA